MSLAAERPALLVIAGPNGSGKTTLKERLDR
jgi:predicted ABC-type ATPase